MCYPNARASTRRRSPDLGAPWFRRSHDACITTGKANARKKSTQLKRRRATTAPTRALIRARRRASPSPLGPAPRPLRGRREWRCASRDLRRRDALGARSAPHPALCPADLRSAPRYGRDFSPISRAARELTATARFGYLRLVSHISSSRAVGDCGLRSGGIDDRERILFAEGPRTL